MSRAAILASRGSAQAGYAGEGVEAVGGSGPAASDRVESGVSGDALLDGYVRENDLFDFDIAFGLEFFDDLFLEFFALGLRDQR